MPNDMAPLQRFLSLEFLRNVGKGEGAAIGNMYMNGGRDEEFTKDRTHERFTTCLPMT